MRKRAINFIYFILVLGVFAGISQAEIYIVEYSDTALSRSDCDYHFNLENTDRLTINGRFSLPVQTIYFEISGCPDPAAISIAALGRTFLGRIGEDVRSFERPMTSLEPRHYPADMPNNDISSVIYESEIIKDNDRNYLRLTLLPVTASTNGMLVFNRHIELHLPGAIGPVDASEFIRTRLTRTEKNVRAVSSYTSSSTGLPLGCEYIIVTTPALDTAFNTLARFKRLTGTVTEIALIDSVYAHYDGLDNAAKLRNYLIDFYNSGGRYVLLGGDDNLIPVRYLYYYNTSQPPSDPYNLMPSDLYYADTDGDWDYDGDGIYGEPDHDRPNFIPELKVGRVPVATDTLAANYVAKLIAYYTDPGNGDYDYLARSLFFTADQMRDYPSGGQHKVIAAQIPAGFVIDTTTGVEFPSGNHPSPTSPGGPEGIDRIADGFGLIHILAHGRSDGFMVRSANYAEWPASYILSTLQTGGQGSLFDLEANGKTSVYYSLACNMGGFDLDSIGGQPTGWSFVERIIGLPHSGAVGMVANTRWGWVYSSYLLERSFTEHLFGDADGSPVTAMYLSWLDYPYYRDLIYGQNYYGDPTLKMYLERPDYLEMNIDPMQFDKIIIKSGRTKNPIPNAAVVLSNDDIIIEEGVTDELGRYFFSEPLVNTDGYCLTVVKDGFTVAQDIITPSLVLDNDEDDNINLPDEFRLEQNYPNPFNPTTAIPYTLPMRSDVVLEVFNILGQRIWAETMSDQAAGSHIITWDGTFETERPIASGIYFYRLTAGQCSQTRKMVLLR